MIKIPPYLKPGDTIGITCPASRIDPDAVRFAADVLASWGWKVRPGNTTKTRFHNFSATDEARLAELQEMLDDETVNAILFGRGGYGLIRLIDNLDFRGFQRHPKWLAGYSDITVLHAHVHRHYGIATLHSPMCSGITPETAHDPYVESLRNALSGQPYTYRFPAHPLNRSGRCRGALTGGNLSLLANLSGTVSQPDVSGKILFIEDVGEYRYSVDRMMYNLKRAGWLGRLQGLLVGSFTAAKETDVAFGQTEYEIILDKVKEYDYPVAFGFPAGHQPENYALKLGLVHEMSIDGSEPSVLACS
jgi:muramoyltetrapeptide carboxypeptidase